jgi:hypothetical protein
MDLEALNVTLSYPMLIGGLGTAGIGMIWLLVRCFRRGQPFFHRIGKPLMMVAIGLVIAAAPPIVGRLVPIDLGPRDMIVDGERHLTLTGWDRKDYSFLPQKSDAVRLQMANADVTDATIELLADFKKLQYLDVADSKVTDRGLEQIAKLPALETLYLTNTKVTAGGVEKYLTKHPTLKVIWLRGTGVTKEAAEIVKAGKQGRRVFVD